MRRQIIIYFTLIFVFCFLGASVIVYNTYKTSNTLRSVIGLHEIEDIRYDLFISMQKVQIYVHAPSNIFAKHLDEIISKAAGLDKAINRCHDCHHRPDVLAKINATQQLVNIFKKQLSYLITMAADTDRRMNSQYKVLNLGNTILDQVQEMIQLTGNTVQRRSDEALEQLKQMYPLIGITILATFLLALFVAQLLTRRITQPIKELVDASRKISSGQWGYETNFRATAEFAELMKSFNSMSISLADERKLVQKQVEELENNQKQIVEAKKLESLGILAGGIAHDFNNILAAILGNINLALFNPDLQDKTKKLLSEAEKATLRARDLTQQLLTFAKGGEPIKETSSLDEIVKDSADFVLHGKKVACRYNAPENLWQVDIDKGQISQVIQNIVLNASHAMPKGGVITVTYENVSSGEYSNFPLLQNRKYVKISIQDEGDGIPVNIIDKIFDPYFSTKYDGSGLGLAITHSIINKHGGHIAVESSPGIGATFIVFLLASEQVKVQSQKPRLQSKAMPQAKILVMDDEEMVRTMAKEMLVELGHKVKLSENGEEAIKLYQKAFNANNKFDLVIMDLTIPGGMGGQRAVQEVLAINSNAKVIVSSGYSNDPIMANYKDFGFCSAIAKPYQLQELSKIISQIIG